MKLEGQWLIKELSSNYTKKDIRRQILQEWQITQEACDRYIKAYKKVEKLSKTMKNEEIAQILGMGKSLVEEYIKILNKEEWLMAETSYAKCRNLSVKWEFSK